MPSLPVAQKLRAEKSRLLGESPPSRIFDFHRLESRARGAEKPRAFGSSTCSMLNLTSSAVSAVPSWNWILGRNVNVHQLVR